MDNVKITVYSQVYNTPEVMLRRAIESILGQTYQNLEYILVDNGSTDGTKELLREYAARDSRVRLVRYEENKHGVRTLRRVRDMMTGDYLIVLDSDDWYESDALEQLLAFAKENNLDIACCGSNFVNESGSLLGTRSLPSPLLLNSKWQLAEFYPIYHQFFRTRWNKLVRSTVFQSVDYENEIPLKNSIDTVIAFAWLRAATRVGIKSGTLHNYTLRSASYSYVYNPVRFDADIFLYNDAVDFLQSLGYPVSQRNREFISFVYANAVRDTANVIAHSSLTPRQKLHEYRTVATHPTTLAAYSWKGEPVRISRRFLLISACNAIVQLVQGEDDGDFRAIVQVLCPKCGLAVTQKTISLFLNKELQEDFLQDNRDTLVQKLLKISRNTATHLIVQVLQKLAMDKAMLFWIDDPAFLHHYSSIYWAVWQDRYEEALAKMTNLIQDGNIECAQETFYKLLVNLSAQLGQETPFIFGKIKLSQYYLSQSCLELCAELVTELEEMGLEKDEEIVALREALSIRRGQSQILCKHHLRCE